MVRTSLSTVNSSKVFANPDNGFLSAVGTSPLIILIRTLMNLACGSGLPETLMEVALVMGLPVCLPNSPEGWTPELFISPRLELLGAGQALTESDQDVRGDLRADDRSLHQKLQNLDDTRRQLFNIRVCDGDRRQDGSLRWRCIAVDNGNFDA